MTYHRSFLIKLNLFKTRSDGGGRLCLELSVEILRVRKTSIDPTAYHRSFPYKKLNLFKTRSDDGRRWRIELSVEILRVRDVTIEPTAYHRSFQQI